MYVVLSICLALAALVGVGQLLERRRRRRITEMITARGGRVISVKLAVPPSSRRVVRYVGPQGEMREALVSSGTVPTVCEDRPFQAILREEYERATSDDMLRKLILAAESSRLPGFEAYKAIVRELAAGLAESVSIEESPADVQPHRRFAPVLQCVEAVSISSKADAGQMLELVADGKNVDLRWSLEGEPPHRLLVLTAVGPRV